MGDLGVIGPQVELMSLEIVHNFIKNDATMRVAHTINFKQIMHALKDALYINKCREKIVIMYTYNTKGKKINTLSSTLVSGARQTFHSVNISPWALSRLFFGNDISCKRPALSRVNKHHYNYNII